MMSTQQGKQTPTCFPRDEFGVARVNTSNATRY